MSPPSLAEGLSRSRALVCAGTGGVGKTTIAAALGLRAAMQGRRTLILTIDPARRLADALGLEGLDSTPTAVELPASGSPETAPGGGALDAMMLDPKPTFDRLVTRLAQDEATLERILGNRIYRHLSQALAGSADYAAMEQVHEMVECGRYDLVIVDTPPSSHALDFLRAPRRLREFLESRFVRALLRPAMSASRLGFRVFGRSLHRIFGLLDRIAGASFLDDLTEFLSAIDGLSEGFRDRASRVERILLGDHTSFVLICGASSGSEPNTLEFLDELDALDVRLAALIVNRVRPWPVGEGAGAWLARANAEGSAGDAEKLRAAFEETATSGIAEAKSRAEHKRHASDLLAALEETAHACDEADRTIEILSARAARLRVRCHSVPELADDVARLEGLLEIGAALCGKASGTRRSPAEAPA
ncbi:MAG: ArsA family ATPase [bacterium]|nr:ArsA family ATPase [bacterium]